MAVTQPWLRQNRFLPPRPMGQQQAPQPMRKQPSSQQPILLSRRRPTLSKTTVPLREEKHNTAAEFQLIHMAKKSSTLSLKTTVSLFIDPKQFE
jgi:hypothetical protein